MGQGKVRALNAHSASRADKELPISHVEKRNKIDKKTQTFLSSLMDLRRRLVFAAVLFCSLILPVISAQMTWALSQHEVQGKSSPIQDQNAQRTEERKRRESERPSEIIQLLGVLPGMKIGEVGAGTGYFTFFLSEIVGESGIVYANEIDKDALVELESQAKESGALKNIVTVLAPEDDPSFPSRDLDMIVAYNSFHDIKNRAIWLRNAVKYLKPKGTLAIIDGYWPEHGGLTLDKLRDYGAQVGFRLLLHKDFSFGERSHHVHLFERDR